MGEANFYYFTCLNHEFNHLILTLNDKNESKDSQIPINLSYKMSGRMNNYPDIKKLLDKQVLIQVGGTRKVKGLLRGFDPFMNLVVDNALEVSLHGVKARLGTVVVRGNSVVTMEVLDSL